MGVWRPSVNSLGRRGREIGWQKDIAVPSGEKPAEGMGAAVRDTGIEIPVDEGREVRESQNCQELIFPAFLAPDREPLRGLSLFLGLSVLHKSARQITCASH